MITYEYACRVCRHEFTREQHIDDEPLKECPMCRVASLYRAIADKAPGFVLHGEGWAKDGYTSKAKKD